MNLRLSIEKAHFCSQEATWCGRIISKDGWRYKEDYFTKILSMPPPKNLGELERCDISQLMVRSKYS